MKACSSGWVIAVLSTLAADSVSADTFERSIRPLLREYCVTCHSTQEQAGELDLERFDSLDHVRQDATIWKQVQDQLELGEMPPEDSEQLSAEQRQRLVEWIQRTLHEIALANAGDPGPLVLRRLSNHEYTYTIRDLTGVQSLDPAREFPVDGAAGEGFTNVGSALVMSPALLSKYLEAAKEVSRHLVLLEDGVRFSPSDSPQDWTDEALTNLRRFYAQYTATTDLAKEVPGTGTVKSEAGTIPLTRYLDALQGHGPREGLSPKYLSILERSLTAKGSSLLWDPLRERFRDGQLTANDIESWQEALWTFNTVGHIGRPSGPKSWQEPINPLVAQQEFRIPLVTGQDTRLFLVAGTAGDGDAGDQVVWQNPRLVIDGRPDIPLASLPEPLTAQAPSVLEVDIPAPLSEGTEFVVTGRLAAADDGSVQFQVVKERPPGPPHQLESSLPVVVGDGSPERKRWEAAFEDFRAIFPAALCYSRIVPIDEVVTLNLYHRDDDPLRRLMLSDSDAQQLDRLWRELLFVGEAAIKQVDAFEQIYQFATQDRPDLVVEFDKMREPILRAADEFRALRTRADAAQRQAVMDLATRAWRRPLTEAEIDSLKDMPPRLMLVRILTSPAFLYRSETPGNETGPVNDWELATRLSYFLWSSLPDEELRADAAAGKVARSRGIGAHTRRMLKDDRVRRLATEFGCQYLHVRDVATLDEKSERHFPTFHMLREEMQEEVTRFFIDLFQNDRNVLALLDADYTFLNKPLADHYGIPFEAAEWQRVDGIRQYGRGGVLGFSATLAKHSGASRTSAILRGTVGQRSAAWRQDPNPPKGVPTLPEEAPEGLSERQLIERHSSDARCAGCHKRIDPFGFALEGFDAIGRTREADTKTVVPSTARLWMASPACGTIWRTSRRADFLRQFSRKLLGYALGRSVQLSDQPLIDNLTQTEGGHVGKMIEQIVLSPQFREIRGKQPSK
jgi:hypothetical protein